MWIAGTVELRSVENIVAYWWYPSHWGTTEITCTMSMLPSLQILAL